MATPRCRGTSANVTPRIWGEGGGREREKERERERERKERRGEERRGEERRGEERRERERRGGAHSLEFRVTLESFFGFWGPFLKR